MDSRKVGAGAGENLQKRDEVIEMEIKKQEQTARKRLRNLEKDVHSERTRRKQSRQVERQELSARKKPQFAKEVTWRTSVKFRRNRQVIAEAGSNRLKEWSAARIWERGATCQEVIRKQIAPRRLEKFTNRES